MNTVGSSSIARNIELKEGFSNDVPPELHDLLSLNPESEEFAKLVRSFLSSKDKRKTILELSEGDARIFIEIIDRAFQAARLETKLLPHALYVLRNLCGRTSHLPKSYLLSDEFDLSGPPDASGVFADIRMRVCKGESVVVRTLRVSEMDDKAKIRKRFCKEVAMWKNLSHPNILNLTGILDTLDDGKFSMVSKRMANGNIVEYVHSNAGNHLELLADAVKGLKYLHSSNITHGNLKGANILVTNTNPVTACLADFVFTTIARDPSLGTESLDSTTGGGVTPFMAPELLVPSKFGLERYRPSKEADIYGMAMVIYQVLTGTLPFGKVPDLQVVFKVLSGERPSKPANAPELGLSDNVWKLLEDCWQAQRALRPSVESVLDEVRTAASACGTLSSIGGVTQRYENPESDSTNFDLLFLEKASDNEDIGIYPTDRLPSQGSTRRGTPTLDPPLQELSGFSITEPAQTSTDALASSSRPRGKTTSVLPEILFSPASDPIPVADPAPRRSTFSLGATIGRLSGRGNSSPQRSKGSAKSGGLFSSMTPQRELSREPSISSLVASSLLIVPEAAASATIQAGGNSTPRRRISWSRLTKPDASLRTDGET